MPIPIDPRKKPLDVKVHVSTGAGIDITWSDQHTSHYDFPYLREWCPCATCNDQRDRKQQALHTSADAAAASQDSASHPAGPAPSIGLELPIYKPKARAASARAVGNYALQIEFTDGHSTGIYSFNYLREVCPCAGCARQFRSQAPHEAEA